MTTLNTKPATLTTTYLEMVSPDEFVPSYVENQQMKIEQLQGDDVDFYLSLYRGVGQELAWRDRVLMPKDELSKALHKASIYVMYVNGTPAGYVELEVQGTDVEIAYFGLFKAYQGLGLGKHLLSYGIEKAWELGPQRVYVHTCNLDGEHATINYTKRGFKIYMQTQEPMPERYL
jgi:GNAT superfamily N-acetyltransferase